ncbi:hypothetical protein D3C84_442460 [compost metagenome]|jgi:hypothetical protein
MNVVRFCAAPLAALALMVSASVFAHEPSEKVTVLQDELLKNASATQPARLLVFMVLAPDEKVLIPLEN